MADHPKLLKSLDDLKGRTIVSISKGTDLRLRFTDGTAVIISHRCPDENNDWHGSMNAMPSGVGNF